MNNSFEDICPNIFSFSNHALAHMSPSKTEALAFPFLESPILNDENAQSSFPSEYKMEIMMDLSNSNPFGGSEISGNCDNSLSSRNFAHYHRNVFPSDTDTKNCKKSQNSSVSNREIESIQNNQNCHNIFQNKIGGRQSIKHRSTPKRRRPKNDFDSPSNSEPPAKHTPKVRRIKSQKKHLKQPTTKRNSKRSNISLPRIKRHSLSSQKIKLDGLDSPSQFAKRIRSVNNMLKTKLKQNVSNNYTHNNKVKAQHLVNSKMKQIQTSPLNPNPREIVRTPTYFPFRNNNYNFVPNRSTVRSLQTTMANTETQQRNEKEISKPNYENFDFSF